MRPSHLEPLTAAEHTIRHKTTDDGAACIRGHEFTPENTYYRADDETRQCRQCRADRERNRLAALPDDQRKALIDQRSERRRRTGNYWYRNLSDEDRAAYDAANREKSKQRYANSSPEERERRNALRRERRAAARAAAPLP